MCTSGKIVRGSLVLKWKLVTAVWEWKNGVLLASVISALERLRIQRIRDGIRK